MLVRVGSGGIDYITDSILPLPQTLLQFEFARSNGEKSILSSTCFRAIFDFTSSSWTWERLGILQSVFQFSILNNINFLRKYSLQKQQFRKLISIKHFDPLIFISSHTFSFKFNYRNLEMDSQEDKEEEFYESSEDSDNPKLDYEEQFRIQKKQKKYQEMSFILGCLKNHFIFYNLSEAELENVAKKMFYCSVPTDQYIFKEGSKALCFFIIEKGMMQIITNQKVKKQLRVGDGFGELALLYKAPRAASVKACETCNLWGIDRDTFRRAVEEIITLEYEENRKFMENVRFFTCLSNEHKDSIAAALITQRFSKDQIIVTEGDPGSSFYIIKEGTASLWKGNKELKRLEKADSFGEQALFYNTIRQMTVKAEDDVVCLVLGRETLSKILGDQIFTVTFRNFLKWAFEKHFNFSKLTKAQVEKILDVMKINSYKSGSVVIKKNTQTNTNQKVIVVIEGALKKSKNMHPIASKSQIYGEQFLMETKSKNSDDEIVMDSDGVLAEISVEQFKEIIGGCLDVVITKNEKIINDKLKQDQLHKTKFFHSLNEFVLIKEMREGVFGPVYLVQHITEKGLYTLKCYSKQKIQEHFVERYFIQEKNLLKTMNFPFVMELYKTFKDHKFLYSLVEFIRGEELYDVIRQIGLLSTEDCQFYIGCMILILEYFSTLGVIYRDLKPENFIVDMKGYPKLIDLGTAKVIKMKNPLQAKTYTVIGTPYYMAPEIINNGKGYNFTVDLYSLGVCMFEFLCGYVPFGQKSQDPIEIYEEILNAQVKYPKFLKDKKAKKLMDQFLSKTEPENRLGGANFKSLKTHPWFENLDWDQLKNKKIQAPKFDRFPNCEQTQAQLINYGKHARNLEQFLNQAFPNRSSGDSKPYDQW